jgi:hypothetical protein
MLNAIAVLVVLAGLPEMEAPGDAEILRAIPPITRGVPYVFEEFRDDLVIVKNRHATAKIGPQRFYPFIGPARITTTNWECVVYYTQTIQSDFPFPVKLTKNRVQVVYMEKAGLAK